MRPARLFLVLLSVIAASAAPVGQQSTPSPAAPRPIDKATFDRRCGTCHEPERGLSSRRTRDLWLQTINVMVARGAQGTDEEFLGVVDYLTREHGRVNVNLANATEIAQVLGLTPAEGAAIVQHRREHGTFADAASLERVSGLDAKKLQARTDAIIFGSRVASKAGHVPVAALTAANNWPGVSGGPQREGWARAEAMLSRGTAGEIKLLYSRSLDDKPRRLTPPLVLGNLISYRGFKEMLFLAGENDTVYSIDAVLNRVLWTARLPIKAAQPAGAVAAECAGGSAAIVMTGTAATAMGGVPGIRRPGSLPPGVLPAAATSKNPLIVGLASGFGRNGLVLALGRDGNVYPLYQSNGAVLGTPVPFLPAGSRVQSLNLFDNTLQAATVGGCGSRSAVYAVDLAANAPITAKFETGEAARGSAGTAIGNDGVVYVHAGDRVVALTPKDLREKDHFVLPGPAQGITPSVFRRGGADVVIAGGADRLVLLDSTSLGGADHRVALAQTETAGTPRGAFATWEDPDTGVRWIYAPLQKSPSASGGSIAAYKVEDRNGRPTLTLAWTSPEMVGPAAPVVANGLIFALSTGGPAGSAVLLVLDAATGRQLYSSGNTIRSAADPETGVAVANGRAYFSTLDGTVYCFGIPTEH